MGFFTQKIGPLHKGQPSFFPKKIDRLRRFFKCVRRALEYNSNALLSLFAYATSISALYAATLCALTIFPRKARRDPTYALAYDASLFAYAFDTPPYAFA